MLKMQKRNIWPQKEAIVVIPHKEVERSSSSVGKQAACLWFVMNLIINNNVTYS